MENKSTLSEWGMRLCLIIIGCKLQAKMINEILIVSQKSGKTCHFSKEIKKNM